MSLRVPKEIETLGEAIRWAREQQKMTLRALALKLEVSAPFLSDVEHDRRKPDVAAVAKVLDVSEEDLLTLSLTRSAEEWRKKHPELAALLDDLQKLRPRCACPWCRRIPYESRSRKP